MPPAEAAASQRHASDSTGLPKTLAGFRDHHAGASIIVCGCGSSLSGLAEPERYITIGVNDVGRMFQPDYLVVLNHRAQFDGDRFRYVEQTGARALFTHLNLGLRHLHVVRFMLGQRAGVALDNPNTLPYTRNSPYVAVCLAAQMGAARIGLIGVDFTNNHFFAATGVHTLAREVPQIDREYRALHDALAERGIQLFNLSAESRLTGLPKITQGEFAAQAKSERSLRIVSYATTPVVGVPAILARCIGARTPHHARAVWARNSYDNDFVFTGDVEWTSRPEAAAALVAEADVVVAHNGRIDTRHAALLERKPVLSLAHNPLWNASTRFVSAGWPGLVVAQSWATLPELASWAPVPNPMPLWEAAFQPEAKGERIAIAYTPSTARPDYPPGHFMHLFSKGFRRTHEVLANLARRFPLTLEVVHHRQVPHAEALAMKRRAHIVIDECVTGGYHRNSLEGLACGAVVVNGVGRVAEVADLIRRVTGAATIPFETAGLDDLETVLARLIALGPQELARRGADNRRWMEEHWDFADQWRRFWLPQIDRALEKAGTPPPTRTVTAFLPRARPAAPAPPPATASVIVPFGGADRLPMLEAALSALRRCRALGPVILVEMDAAPHAAEVASRLADVYLFAAESGPFHKTRAMNLGLPFVETSHFLWLDADVVLSEAFIQQALTECHERNLDCLVPWSAVHFLSAEDSARVNAATHASAFRPASVLAQHSGARGAAVLVRSEFARTYGGAFEDFHGWGGEDTAWFVKTQILGRAGLTHHRDRPVWHLHHANSVGHVPRERLAVHPHHAQNVAVLKRVRSHRTATSFLREFPAPKPSTAPWIGSKRVACSPRAAGLGRRLAARYGEAVTLAENEPADLVLDCRQPSGAQEAGRVGGEAPAAPAAVVV